MRLIDADALYAKAAKLEEEAMEDFLNCNHSKEHEKWLKLNTILIERTGFKFDIADAPTIEERKTGKWEWVEEKVGTFLETGRTIFDAHSKCSECGARAFDDMVDDEFLTPYCPQCGARMENGDD